MPAPADQFQRKTGVRLPFTDAYYRERGGRVFRASLKQAFRRPLLTVTISQSAVSGSRSLEDVESNGEPSGDEEKKELKA